MKKEIVLSFILLIFVTSFVCASEFPAYTDKYVNDFAKVLSADQASQLRNIFSDVEQNTTAEVVFVSVSTTEPYVPEEYRTKLFAQWGVGKADKDNGLLVLYAVKEKRIEVEVGYGLEGILPDSKVGRMLDAFYVPLRDQNKTTEGIISFSEEVSKVLKENADEIRSGQGNSGSGSDGFTTFLIVLVFILVWVILLIAIYFAKRKQLKSEKKYRKYSNSKLFWLIVFSQMFRGSGSGSSGGGFSGGGFGGGGGGFGGGGSGGGGAGR